MDSLLRLGPSSRDLFDSNSTEKEERMIKILISSLNSTSILFFLLARYFPFDTLLLYAIDSSIAEMELGHDKRESEHKDKFY